MSTPRHAMLNLLQTNQFNWSDFTYEQSLEMQLHYERAMSDINTFIDDVDGRCFDHTSKNGGLNLRTTKCNFCLGSS